MELKSEMQLEAMKMRFSQVFGISLSITMEIPLDMDTLSAFTKQWCRFRLTLNIFENDRHILGGSMFTPYTEG